MRARWWWAAVVPALLAACAGPGGLDPRTARFPAPRFEPVKPAEAVLAEGGPTLLWVEDHDVPLVRLVLGFRGGELYDPDDRLGLARVAERAWRTGGAGDWSPEAFDEALESRGIELDLTLGRTQGWITLSVLPGDLEQGLDLLAALVWEPRFDPDRVAWARTQVEDAIRREADDPQGLAFRELRRALYAGHPRGRVPTLESVGRVDRSDVVELHRRVVTSSAWIVGAVGDFDPAALSRALAGRFGRLPGNGDGFQRIPPPAPAAPRTVLVPKALPQATVVWARLAPARSDPDFYPMTVLNHALGAGGFGSRLMREIRSNRGLAYSVGSYYQGLPGFGVVGAYALTKTGSVGEVMGLISGIVAETARDGLEAGELERSRQALLNRRVFRYEDPARVVRDRMGLWLDGLPPDLSARYPAGIARVGPQDVRRTAREYLTPDRGVWVVVGDLGPDDPLWQGPVDVVEVDD